MRSKSREDFPFLETLKLRLRRDKFWEHSWFGGAVSRNISELLGKAERAFSHRARQAAREATKVRAPDAGKHPELGFRIGVLASNEAILQEGHR